MSRFRDEEAASAVFARFARLAPRDWDRLFAQWTDCAPDPDASLANLERYLRMVGEPVRVVDQLCASSDLGRFAGTLAAANAVLAARFAARPQDLGECLEAALPGMRCQVTGEDAPDLATVVGHAPVLTGGLATRPELVAALAEERPVHATDWFTATVKWLVRPEGELGLLIAPWLDQPLKSLGLPGLFAIASLAAREAVPNRGLEAAFAGTSASTEELREAVLECLGPHFPLARTEVALAGGVARAFLETPLPMPGLESQEAALLAVTRPRAIGDAPVAHLRLPGFQATTTDWMHLKRHHESAVPAQHRHRHVNLTDIDWCVTLPFLRSPLPEVGPATIERLNVLLEHDLLSPLEHEAIVDARAFLIETRTRLALLGHELDIVPENPDKLRRLAASFGMSDGNSFLAAFEGHNELARAVSESVLARLGS